MGIHVKVQTKFRGVTTRIETGVSFFLSRMDGVWSNYSDLKHDLKAQKVVEEGNSPYLEEIEVVAII